MTESANTHTLTIGEWQIDDFQHGVIPSIRLTAPFGSGCWTYYDVTDGLGHVIWCLLRMLIDEVPKLTPSDGYVNRLRKRVIELEQERQDLLVQVARTAQDGLALAASALHAPMGSLLQRVMARLADMLDADKFNEIEALVKAAGYDAPTALVAHESPKVSDNVVCDSPLNDKARRLGVNGDMGTMYSFNGWDVEYVGAITKLMSPDGVETNLLGLDAQVDGEVYSGETAVEFALFVRAVGAALQGVISGHLPLVADPAEFEIHNNGEYFAATSGPREKAWAEALRYVSHCKGTATVFEVVKREIKL